MSHSTQINGAQMRIQECNAKIASINNDIALLRQRQANYENLRQSYNGRKREFEDKMSRVSSRAQQAPALSQVRIAISYSESMQKLVRGPRYFQANDSFVIIAQKLSVGISRVEEEIARQSQQIQALTGEVGSLNRQVSVWRTADAADAARARREQ